MARAISVGCRWSDDRIVRPEPVLLQRAGDEAGGLHLLDELAHVACCGRPALGYTGGLWDGHEMTAEYA